MITEKDFKDAIRSSYEENIADLHGEELNEDKAAGKCLELAKKMAIDFAVWCIGDEDGRYPAQLDGVGFSKDEYNNKLFQEYLKSEQ